VGDRAADPPEGQSHLGFALRSATDLDTVALSLLRDLAALPGATRAGLALTEGGGRRLRFRSSDGDRWCHIDAFDDVPLTWVVRSGQPVLGAVDDFGGRFAGMLARQRELGTCAIASLPLPGAQGSIGGLVVYYGEPQAFLPAQRRALEAAARRTADAVERVRSEGYGAPSELEDLSEAGARAASLVLDADPRAAGVARRFLRGRLDEWDVGEEAAGVAELCLSELVTNAVVHARTTSVLKVSLDEGALTVSVRDRGGVGETPSLVEDDDPLKVAGRGLQLVDVLSDRWGSEQDRDGTTSWFVLEVDPDRSERTG
jgi:anti-sigma regulatory factor (Ser/Thr protein kinase)